MLSEVVKLAKSVLKGPMACILGAASFLACVIFGVDATLVIFSGFAVGVALIAVNAYRRGEKR